MSIADMRKIMLHSAYYKEWKQDPKNSKKVKPLQRLNADGEISEELLEKNDPYWPDRVGEKKCACHPHTGMQYACKAISHWRRLQHVNCDCDCANCGGSPDSVEHRAYFAATSDVSALGDCVSCARDPVTNIRPLECMLTHDHWRDKFPVCPLEEEVQDPPIKFLKSEPVQHKKAWAAQNEWVHDELEITEYLKWMKELYDSIYRLHNFVAKWQTRNMGLCLRNMRSHWLVLQFDFGNGYGHRQQNSGTCNHPKISQLFIIYAHHSPVFDPSSGEKTSHTTDTWTFWGDDSDEHDATKNCFYVHGSIDEVTRYYTGGEDRIIPADPLPEVHAWCDGSGEQNKGRRTFRMCTEFPQRHGGIGLTFNFAATNHFGGNWDAKGGRECRRCYRSELDAALEHGTGRILPTARDCAELLVEEMSLTTKGKRVAAGGNQHENKDYTINRSFYRVWDTKNPLPRAGLKEAGAIEGTRTHYCYAAISTPGIMSTTQSLTPHCPSAFAPHSS
jgi:hypothetical protein